MKELGKRLRELRVKYDMSQDDVARALGVTAQAISKWENGRSDPEISNLIPISDLFHIPVDELLEKDKHHEDWEERWVDVIESNDSSQVLEFLKDALTEFPGDYRFRYRLASQEYFLAENEVDEGKRMRLLALADDHLESLRKEYPEFSNAVDMHVRVLSALGRKTEAADLTKLSLNRDRLLLSILEGEDLKKQKQKLITLSFLNLFADFMREGSKEALKKAEILITQVADNNPQFTSLLLDVYYQRALQFCKEGNKNDAVSVLKTGYKLVQSYSEVNTVGNKDETVFSSVIPLKTKRELIKQFNNYVQNEQFSGLRDVDGYAELSANICEA